MNWKSWFRRNPAVKPSGPLRPLSESIVSAKIIAIVLVTVFIPSILITVLGIVAVYRAERSVSQTVEYPIQSVLFRLEQRLVKEWDQRLLRVAERIAVELDLNRFLHSLIEDDPYVRDAVLFVGGEFRDIDRESPFWRLESPLDDPGLSAAWGMELRARDFEAALVEYTALLERAPPELEVEALAGAARCHAALGQRRESAVLLRRLLARYGNSEDGTGLPRALPTYWRLVRLHLDEGDLVAAATTARQLTKFLFDHASWIDAELARRYYDHIEAYRRETGDFKLSVRLRELASPVSTLLLDGSYRDLVREHALEKDQGRERGYVALEPPSGETLALAYVRTPEIGRTVYLVLDATAHLRDALLFTRELGLVDSRLHFEPLSDPQPTEQAESDGGRSVPHPFPRPFQDYRLSYELTPDQVPRELQHLGTLEAAGLVWALIVLVLTILLGVMITVRSILQELRVSKLKSDFVSFVTHELKTPLTAIRMITETMLLGRTAGPSDERRCVEMIDKEASRLYRLIEQILEFSRIERKQQPFNFTSCDMAEVVHDAVRIFRDQNPEERVEITINQAQKMSRIRMDRSAMVELLLNLLSNAVKYSRQTPKRVVVNLKESIDNIFVEVVDFGVGIARHEQKKIFEKFYRAQDYLTRDVDGTGLGLTFAKYVASVHNGDIRVSSTVNHGSTFTLELRKDQVLAE